MTKIKSEASQVQLQSAEQDAVENVSRSQQQALEQTAPSENRVIQGLEPRYPRWPISKPGPRSAPPVPDTRPVNAFRPEQVAEIDYNQETGEPSVDSPQRSVPDASIHGLASFNTQRAHGQSSSTQNALGKRKERL